MHDPPEFRCYTPCEVIKWLVLASAVFAGGGVLLKWLTRPRGVEALDAEHWLRFDMEFIAYGCVAVLAVGLLALAVSLLVHALRRTVHCVLCCHACRWCCSGNGQRGDGGGAAPPHHRLSAVPRREAPASQTLAMYV